MRRDPALNELVNAAYSKLRQQARALRTRRKEIVAEIRDIRGAPAEEYAGDHPSLCNAKTKAGMFCRGLAMSNGRCRNHGGEGEL